MADSNALSYWKIHTYSRHGVDKDIQEFCGWKKLGQIFDAMPNETIRDIEVTAFLLAGRITEVLGCYKGMFEIQEDRKRMMVKDYQVLKRWKSVDYVVVCKRCETVNDKFEMACKSCGANLIYGGEKKHKTMKVQHKRLPFYFPLNEKFVPFLLKRLDHATNLLFPSPLSNGKPYSRKWVYAVLARNEQVGRIAGLDRLYSHWFRAQRLMQLGNERGLDEMELMAFSGIVKSETLSKYSKKVHSYLDKMGIG